MSAVWPTTSVMPLLSDESRAIAETGITLSVSELSSHPAPSRAAAANRNMLIFFIIVSLSVYTLYQPGFCTSMSLRLISSSGMG